MPDNNEISRKRALYIQLARLVLVAFILTFLSARIIVLLIMSQTIPDLYLHIRGTHIHHLNYGIFLLAAVGGFLLLCRPSERGLSAAAVVYGIGMALTFDEFGMWIHLGGSYWQRASWDAVIVLAALFGLIAFASTLKKIRPRHWLTGIIVVIMILIFFFMLYKSLSYASKIIQPKIQKIESSAQH
jgi:hypothetical protein